MKINERSLISLLEDWSTAVAGTSLPKPPPYSGPDVLIQNFVEHSDYVKPGDCFIARVRTGTDGHPYIHKAVNNGAALILGQRPGEDFESVLQNVPYLQAEDSSSAAAWLAAAFYDFPGTQLINIGVTGTDGKTTTVNLIHQVLQAAGIRSGMLSTIKASFGGSEEPLALHVTTPEAPVIQRHLRRMVDEGLTHCVLEVTSHGLAQNRVAAVDFDITVVTNVTHEHLDYHGSYENYLKAKSRLFRSLSASSSIRLSGESPKSNVRPRAVLNADDASFIYLSEAAGVEGISYGLNEEALVTAKDIDYHPAGANFTLCFDRPGEGEALEPSELPISTALIGPFNIYNILAAAAVGLALGIEAKLIKEGVEALTALPGRMERVVGGQPFEVIVDFAHTPNALEKAIAASRRMVNGRVITVFGSAGKRDVAKRRLMAEISAAAADISILTAEDPRNESLDEILEAMAAGCRAKGGTEGESFWRVPDRGRAIYWAYKLAQEEDLILICGKGHEQSMCFGEIEFPWDDIEAARKMLAAYLNDQPPPDSGLPTF